MKKSLKTRGSLQSGVTNVTGEAAISVYLDDNRANLAFRRVVPPHLRAFIFNTNGKPRSEWRVSLRTNDRRLAKELCHIEAVKTDAIIRKAEAALAASLAEGAKSPAQRDFELAQWEFDRAAEEDASQDVMQHEWEQEQREPLRQALLSKLAKPRSQLSPEDAATRDLIADGEFDPPSVKQERQHKFVASWNEGAAEVAQALKARRSGDASLGSYPRLIAMFDDFTTENDHAPSTRKRWRAVMHHLVGFLGHDDASKVTHQNAIDWKNALLAERKPDGSPQRINRTVHDVFLASAKATFKWGKINARVNDNPFADVSVKVPRRQRLRDPDFTEEEGLLILRGTLLPHSDRLSPPHALARRWVPWICAYTGARVNEITQLRSEDVTEVKGHWIIRITPEAGSQKKREARIVPIHPHLVEQGFPELAKSFVKGPLFFDPASARGGSQANPQSKKVGERLAAWVRKLGVDDPEVQPNHAWRHLFKTRAKIAKMDPDAREAIPGHTPGTEGRKYGINDVVFLAEEIAKLPRFDV